MKQIYKILPGTLLGVLMITSCASAREGAGNPTAEIGDLVRKLPLGAVKGNCSEPDDTLDCEFTTAGKVYAVVHEGVLRKKEITLSRGLSILGVHAGMDRTSAERQLSKRGFRFDAPQPHGDRIESAPFLNRSGLQVTVYVVLCDERACKLGAADASQP